MISRRSHRLLLLALLFQLISPTLSFCQDQYLLAKADSLYRIGEELFSSKDYDKAIESFSKVLELIAKAGEEESDLMVNILEKLGDSHYYLGDYSTALEYYLRKIRIVEKPSNRDDVKWAQCLNEIGVCYKNLGDYAKALEYHQQTLAIREKVYGKEHPSYATSLNNIGNCYSDLRDYAKALEYYQQSLTIREKALGKEHPNYASSLNNIGNCYRNLGDYAKALEYYQQSLLIWEKALGKEHPNYATSLNNIGNCYGNLGDYSKALEYYLQALPIREKVYGKEHPNYATSLNNIGNCYRNLGDYAKALEYYQQSLLIWEKALGKEHPNYATSLNNIGNCYHDLGDYAKALEYKRQALAIQEKVYGKEHPNYAKRLNDIGILYRYLGDYAKALEHSQQALAIQEKVLGKEHSDYATSLNSIGCCYMELGDYAKALKYYQQALAIREKIYGKEHPDYASILNNIGYYYRNLGDYAKALEYLKRALSIFKKVYGKEGSEYSICLINIGTCYRDFGDYSKALEYLQQALVIKEMIIGTVHPHYAKILSYIGECYRDLGDNAKALEYFQQALVIREKVLGKGHSDCASSLDNIAVCYNNLGDYAKASEYFSSFSSTASSIVANSFSSLTESQRALFWDKFSDFFTNRLYGYSVRIATPEMNRTAYDGTLLGKGLLLNAETEMRKLILESGDDEALRLYNEVQESRVKLDRLYEDPVGKKEAIDSLNNDIEKRQQELMKRSKVFGDYTRNLAMKWTDVQDALGKKDIAIEFETYTHQDTTFYIALTLRPGYTEPHLVELFNSKDLCNISSKRYYTSTGMTDLVWGNLSDELNGVKNVYFSPAGELNNIGIEYLLDEDGKHLISEKRNYYRLTSTRELVKEHTGRKIANATVYGGIRYDISPSSNLTGEETEAEKMDRTATRSWMPMDSLSVTRGGWVYLPGTKEEAEAISSTLTSRKVHNDLLEGENGTEESFKALSGAKKDVIHIATHGFYWTETEAALSKMETSSFMLDGESKAPKEDKALTRSGLLFAGAQNTFDGKEIPIDVEDGILTAKDISRMDLRGTDLVVISACQSGLGEVTGDGVFGLQRGFKKAGVQSIVMSLWEVSDDATKVMMTRFYENLAKGKGKYDSFREAQKYLRKYEGGLYDEPEYYAAFVLLDAIR